MPARDPPLRRRCAGRDASTQFPCGSHKRFITRHKYGATHQARLVMRKLNASHSVALVAALARRGEHPVVLETAGEDPRSTGSITLGRSMSIVRCTGHWA